MGLALEQDLSCRHVAGASRAATATGTAKLRTGHNTSKCASFSRKNKDKGSDLMERYMASSSSSNGAS